jgi:hypothetical protein
MWNYSEDLQKVANASRLTENVLLRRFTGKFLLDIKQRRGEHGGRHGNSQNGHRTNHRRRPFVRVSE